MMLMPACLAHVKPNMAVIHLCALWVSAQRCTPVYTGKWADIIPQRCALCLTQRCSLPLSLSLLNDALQRKDALHHSHRSSRR